MLEALLIAQLHAAQIDHAVLHGAGDELALARMRAVIERRHDAERQMQTRAAVADLRAGDQRNPVAETGRRSRAARALRDVLVDLAVLERPRPEALDRGDDHARVDLLDRSQENPMRSSTPGPKFSTSTSQVSIRRVSTSLPFAFLVSSVIERLLWFSIVK